MELSEIRGLAKLMHEEELTCVEYESGDVRIRLERSGVLAPVPTGAGMSGAGVQGIDSQGAGFSGAPVPEPGGAGKLGDLGRDFNDMNVVSSPMVGVFYAAPGEDQAPYVHVGDKVKQGDILCIVEAMKVMNEITAQCDGEIVDICVRNGDVVEFGQPLFKLI